MVAVVQHVFTVFKVGDLVTFRLGAHEVVGRVVEDRGFIGVGKRQIVRLEITTDAGTEQFELPAALLQPLKPAATLR
jgi:hypothetical protein